MSVFRDVMVYLGLGADEEYDDEYLGEETYREDSPAEVQSGPGFQAASPRLATDSRNGEGRQAGSKAIFGSNQEDSDRPSAVGAVRPLRSVPSHDDDDLAGAGQFGANEETRMSTTPFGEEGRVRASPMPNSKPRALAPQSFGDAKTIADELRRSVPVIMNLRGLDRELARRLIDFASGSCYSLGGKMEKIAPQVFLIVPKSVEVSDDDRRRIDERGFDRD